MKTQAELQAAVDEVRSVCKKHGVGLIGTCESEGIHGEITILDLSKDIAARDLAAMSNVVSCSCRCSDEYNVDGIGDKPL